MTAITEEELARAIDRTLVASGRIPPAEARPIARLVLDYFGTEDYVLDNNLSAEDRDRFYLLEDVGLLTSEEEEATISRGKSWRIHYWRLKKSDIRSAGQPSGEGAAGPPDAERLYRSIGEAAWHHESGPSGGSPPPADGDTRPS